MDGCLHLLCSSKVSRSESPIAQQPRSPEARRAITAPFPAQRCFPAFARQYEAVQLDAGHEGFCDDALMEN